MNLQDIEEKIKGKTEDNKKDKVGQGRKFFRHFKRGNHDTKSHESRLVNKVKLTKEEEYVEEKSIFSPEHKDYDKLKFIIIGGTEEIGRNAFVYAFREEMILIDCGAKFGPSEKNGVYIIYPDYKFLLKNKDRLKGIFITHCHEDHTGALVHVFKKLGKGFPIYTSHYGSFFLKIEFKDDLVGQEQLQNDIISKIRVIKNNDVVNIGIDFSVDVVENIHSTPGSFSFVVNSPNFKVFHTGDWKFDLLPNDNINLNLQKLLKYQDNIDLLVTDSTRASDKESFSKSETDVKKSFEKLFEENKNKRIIIALFGSNVFRTIDLVMIAKKYRKKTFLAGFGLIKPLVAASQARLLDIRDFDRNLERSKKIEAKNTVILCTGSQGQKTSALYKMANGNHRVIHVTEEDLIVYSSNAIPGNEVYVKECINMFLKRKIPVIHQMIDINHAQYHASGHGSGKDILLLLNFLRPKMLMPVHGDFFLMSSVKQLAIKWGMLEENIILTENGDIFALEKKNISHYKYSFSEIYGDQNDNIISQTVIEGRQKILQGGLIVFLINKEKKLLIDTKTYFLVREFESKFIAFLENFKKQYPTLENINDKECHSLFNKTLAEFTGYKVGELPLLMVEFI